MSIRNLNLKHQIMWLSRILSYSVVSCQETHVDQLHPTAQAIISIVAIGLLILAVFIYRRSRQ